MYKSFLNIKHRNRSNLFWGMDKESDQIVLIDQVKSRGLNCNCRCAHCGEDFIAKLGDVKKHHFAHKSNYDCVYSNEIAIYILVKKLLGKMKSISLPSVTIPFGARHDTVKEAYEASIGEIFYQCDPLQYPPLLIANLNDQPTRIVLAFGQYYTKEDFLLLTREAKEKRWNCLSIELPAITQENSISLRLINESLFCGSKKKHWVNHNEATAALKKLTESAVSPPSVDIHEIAHECPIHRQFQNGIYFARPSDCDCCPFNIRKYPDCGCLAHIGVRQYKDFSIPLDVRLKNVEKLRYDNEERLKRSQRIIVAPRIARPVYSPPRPTTANISRTKEYTTDEKRAIGRREIEKTFDPDSSEIAFDRFDQRWVKCRKCLRIVPSEECPIYGGRQGVNWGTCYECARK